MNSKIKYVIILITSMTVSILIGIIIGIKIISNSFDEHWIKTTAKVYGDITDFDEYFGTTMAEGIPTQVDGTPAVEKDVWTYYLSHKNEYEYYIVKFQLNNLSDVSIPLTKVTIQNDFGINLFIADDFDIGVPVVEANCSDEFELILRVNTLRCSKEDIDKMKKELKIVIEYDQITKDWYVFGIDDCYTIDYSGKIICRNNLK